MPPIETFAKRKTVDLRGRHRLTTAQLAEVDQVGRHPLDDLLYFTVQKGGSRGYELRYLSPETGKRRDMAIGRFPETDPATARERAAEVRALIANNVDPLEERLREQERARSLQTHEAFTMRAALEAHFAIESLRWRNEKYTAQWLGRMFSALKPLLDRPLVAITKGELHDQLVAINRGSHDTAIKVRANLDKLYRRFAGMKGVPESHNPAATLVGLLPRTNPVRHHPALNWREAPAFVRRLRDSNAWISVRLGFEWLILSGGRTDAVTHACWSQVHDASGYWRASPLEAENKRRGDVPLTPRMCEILDAMRPHRIPGADWIFPSPQRKTRSTKRKEKGLLCWSARARRLRLTA